MWLGRELEASVARRAAKEYDFKLQRRNAILKHPEYPWMLANIDYRVTGQRVGVEIKTTNSHRIDFESGDVPPHYYVQCTHYLAVTGWDMWYLMVYEIGRGLHRFKVERNEEEISRLIEAEKAFWEDYVQKDALPPPDGSETAQEIIKSMFPQAKRPTLAIPECDDECAAYLSLETQKKSLEKQQGAIKQRLQIVLGDAEIGDGIDYRVEWKNIAGSVRVDSKALMLNEPTIYQKFLKTGDPTRRFEIKTKRQNKGA